MKHFTLALVALFFSFDSANAQVLAGDIPPGMSLVSPAISLSNGNVSTWVSDSLDLDSDGIEDVKFMLYKGITSIDGANVAKIDILNPLYSFCTHDTLWTYKLVQYDLLDPLTCNYSPGWLADTIIYIGDYGCMGCMGPQNGTDKYIAYQRGATVGWIKLSFELLDQGNVNTPVTLQVFEAVVSNPTSIAELTERPFSIYPNPTLDGRLEFSQKDRIQSIRVFDLLGKEVDYIRLTPNSIRLPQVPGIYLVEATFANGNTFTKRVVRK